jgi:hypothetical protein
MKHLSARAVLGIFAIVPIVVAGGVGVAAASSGEAVDGNCPPTYRLVPADSELRQQIDAATGSVDGFICAMELNERALFDRNLVDNMAR